MLDSQNLWLLILIFLRHYKWGVKIVQPPPSFRWTSPIHPWSLSIQKPGWPEHQYRCAPPARVVGHRLQQEDALLEGGGVPLYAVAPGISDPELRWSTISSFSDWSNKSLPFDSAPHPPPPVHRNKHLADVSLWSAVLGLHCESIPSHSVWYDLN